MANVQRQSSQINMQVEVSDSKVQRLVEKTGECNVISRNVTKRHLRFISDFFTTIVEMRWRWHILLIPASLLTSWLAFALIYLVIVYDHGDVDNQNNGNWTPCIHNVFDFTSALLYSFETQTTIGYGSRVIDPVCWVGVPVAMLQIFIGTLINVLFAGLFLVKISRPKTRRQTLVFSENAVVCRRNGEYQLLFRVGDMRNRSHIIGASVRALLVRTESTAEGECIPLCQYSLSVETETGHNDSYIFLAWPVTVAHRIDSGSPLWDMPRDQLRNEDFEIVVILEGTVELTGDAIQVRTSYKPEEIRWGESLDPLITFPDQDGRYCIDFAQFHHTKPLQNMDDCSAKTWHEQPRQIDIMNGTTITDDSDHPRNFKCRPPIVRSLSHPSHLIQRIESFPAVRKIKSLRKSSTGSHHLVKNGECSMSTCRSCGEMLRISQASSSQELLKQNGSSAAALCQPASPTRSQLPSDDVDSRIASPSYRLPKEGSVVRFQHGDDEDELNDSAFN